MSKNKQWNILPAISSSRHLTSQAKARDKRWRAQAVDAYPTNWKLNIRAILPSESDLGACALAPSHLMQMKVLGSCSLY
jgi:hypothetical protein